MQTCRLYLGKMGLYFYVYLYSKDKQQTKKDVINMVKYWKILCIIEEGNLVDENIDNYGYISNLISQMYNNKLFFFFFG